MMNNHILTCCNVDFAYDSNIRILSDCSIVFSGGQPNYVVGPSGCGKTTLALLLAGALIPQSGQVKRQSEHLVSLVLQFPENLFLTDSVEEELATLPDVSAEEVALATLAHFDLRFADIAHKSPQTLSFGQRRLLAIAIQSAISKHSIILDEPTLGLDERHLDQIAGWISDRCAQGNLCIVITHDLDLLRLLPGKLFILKTGCVQWQGTTAEYLSNEELLRIAGAL